MTVVPRPGVVTADRLSFGGDASAVTVAGGRYITDDVYLEVIGGGESELTRGACWLGPIADVRTEGSV